ncbi:hypothetical protein [Burkholderia sp. S171]|uniref:hypothetical protein n=1 Tax=Burkholderia sp. S171 TaxID=1641860 RepID=UPI001C207E3E|nr:hypothetical protein [Burkholderia sp. S171]
MQTEQTRGEGNNGKLVDQKPPLKLEDVWAIRIDLQNAHAVRDFSPCSNLQSTLLNAQPRLCPHAPIRSQARIKDSTPIKQESNTRKNDLRFL